MTWQGTADNSCYNVIIMEALLGLPFDIVFVVLLVAALMVYNYTLGKHRAATLLIALYVAAALYMLMPVLDFVHEVVPIGAPLLPVIMFGVVFLVTYVVLSRNTFFEPYMVPSGWELGVFSVLHAALIIAILVSIEPSSATASFSPNFSRIFLDPVVRSVVVASPLAILAFFRGNS